MSLAGGSTSKRPKLFQPVICRAPVQAERTIPWARYPAEIGKSRDARTLSYQWVGGWGRRRPPPRMRVRKPLYPARTSRAINSRVIDRRCRDQHGETDRPDQRHRSLARWLARSAVIVLLRAAAANISPTYDRARIVPTTHTAFAHLAASPYLTVMPNSECPWVWLSHGLGWVGSGWVEIFQFFVGWVVSTIAKVLKYLKGLC